MEITSITIDLRNFTPFFSAISALDDNTRSKYLTHIQSYIGLCITNANDIVDNPNDVDFITTGDGVIVIFKNKNHALRGYLYSLIIHKVLKDFFEKLKLKEKDNRVESLDFGIGMDTGKADLLYLDNQKVNYLSEAINISSRLEGLTKTFVSSRLIISNSSFWSVINLLNYQLLKKKGVHEYSELVDKSKKMENNFASIDDIQEMWDLMTYINESLFFRYLSKIQLKGLDSNKVVYNFSNTLFKTNHKVFFHENETALRNALGARYELVFFKLTQ